MISNQQTCGRGDAATQYPQPHWNDTQRSYPPDVCLHHLIEQQALRSSDGIAVVYEGKSLTYAELAARANQVAHFLVAAGLGPESLVGMLMERSLELPIGLLGVLNAGAAYVPLDPDYPAERLRQTIDDARPAIVLTQRHLLDTAHKLLDSLPDAPRVVVVDGEGEIAGQPSTHITDAAKPDNLAYVIYTSGSTGRPKGAMNTHRGICNRLLWMQEEYQLDGKDTVLQKTPASFDVSVWEFFWPLIAGGKLVLAKPRGHLDSNYLCDLIQSQQVTVMHFVPSMLRVFLQEPSLQRCASLRDVICSGEALPADLQHQFFERLDAKLHNLYGPTEAAVDVTYWQCQRGDSRTTVPIGRPVANTQIHLLDQDLQPVPLGDSGELHIGGVQVARGYLNRPELTREKFIPDPFSDDPEARLYKTGDLARYLSDGNIEYLGRIDGQVKIRGFRIELTEIESVLGTHPAIRQAAVADKEYGPGDRRLVAYLVADSKRAPALSKLLELERQGAAAAWTPYELPNGLIVRQINKAETDFCYREIFDQPGYTKHGITINPGDCVFDVGANIGMFSLLAAAAAADVSVYAFEPLPPIYEALKTNAELYDLNIKALPIGLGSEPKTTEFTYYPHATIISGRFANSAEEHQVVKSYLVNEQLADRKEAELSDDVINDLVRQRLSTETFSCQLKTLSQVVREQGIERIDLLKIDVEKSEHEVLAGIEPDDWKKIRQIVIEVHDIDGRLNQVTTLLTERGYDFVAEPVSLVQDAGLFMVYGVSTEASAARDHVAAADFEQPRRYWSKPATLIDEVREFLQEKLPEYMTPALFMFVDELPLSPNGKLDRKALPEPPRSRPKLDQQLVPARSELERRLADIWCRILKVDQIGVHDRFFELGGDSIQAAMFINELQSSLDEFIYVVTIFENPTVADYAAFLNRDYGAAVANWLGHDDGSAASRRGGRQAVRRVDAAMLQRMRDSVPPLAAMPGQSSAAEKNPPAMFILAPPRSGTTLLRVMLAGHPRLFAAPELQLLCFHTLSERASAFTDKFSAWAEGTLRTIMDLQHCDAQQAKQIMQKYEREDYTTKDFYRILQESIGDRILLDKTPSYALDPAVLAKAEQDFRDPLYIHLVRHPCAMVQSFQELHMEQVLYLKDHDFDSRELAELVWTLSHQNIVEFLNGVPKSRQVRLRFEDLLEQPAASMQMLCQGLGLPFHADLLTPYENREQKMVDGIHSESTPMGDVNFLRHGRIDPERADRWKHGSQADLLGDITWELAEEFGYQPPVTSDSNNQRWADRQSMARNRKEQQKQQRARRRRTKN